MRTRAAQPLTRTGALAALVARVVRTREPGKHPATRTFQALRIFINDELGQIERGLAQALELLAPHGRLVAISFHSLEDRLVKEFIRRHSRVGSGARRACRTCPPQAQPPLRRVGRKQRASADEVRANPRARSALLRVAEKPSESARQVSAGAAAQSVASRCWRWPWRCCGGQCSASAAAADL